MDGDGGSSGGEDGRLKRTGARSGPFLFVASVRTCRGRLVTACDDKAPKDAEGRTFRPSGGEDGKLKREACDGAERVGGLGLEEDRRPLFLSPLSRMAPKH